MKATFDPDANPYRETGETYGEYIDRMEKIIYRWHHNHGKLSRKLKSVQEHMNHFPTQDHYANYNRDQIYQDWYYELKILVDIEVSEVK